MRRQFFKNIINAKAGFLMVLVVVISSLFLAMAGGLASLGVYQQKLYLQQSAKQEALHIAEAGINYYRWHLEHDQDDYYDGTGSDPGGGGAPYGPYDHTYTDPNTTQTGVYRLEITPPATGTTNVMIKATGWLNAYPNIKRSIEVRYGLQSLAYYSFLTNTDAWFGPNEEVRGELHSNGGVRMDGSNDSEITSSRSTYVCGTSHGCTEANCASPCWWSTTSTPGCNCQGVWGAGAGSALWQYPVTTVDFNNISADINKLKGLATSSGVYLDSYNKGYRIVFKSDGTFDVYRATSLENTVRQYNDDWSGMENIAEQIKNQSFYQNYAIPANGIIFIEDNVWVEGTVKGRATLVAAKLPDNVDTRKTIHINNNLQYLARDGTNILGLVAQKHVKVPKYAPSTLTIDAVLLAQNGRVFRNYYNSPSVKTSIEVYGGIITNKVWTWTWVDSGLVIDGYSTTTSIYDSQVNYTPPPSFPTTGEYSFKSWEED